MVSQREAPLPIQSAQGRRELAAAAPGHLATVRSMFLDHVTPEELDVIGEVSRRVLDAMEAEELRPA